MSNSIHNIEDEFYKRLEFCSSRYQSSLIINGHSQADALSIIALLLPDLISLALLAAGNDDTKHFNDLKDISDVSVSGCLNAIAQALKKAELATAMETKNELIIQIYSEIDKLMLLLPRLFYRSHEEAFKKDKKLKKAKFLYTLLFLMIPAVFIALTWSYFVSPEPVQVSAPATLTYALKSNYLNKPIQIKYLLKSFSGEFAKVVVGFDFCDNSNKLISRLTYVLSGEKDFMNHINTTVSGVSYITVIKNYNKLGDSQKVIFKNILNDYNDGAKRINAPLLVPNDIGYVKMHIQAWYYADGGRKGGVSADFYSLEKYVN